MHLLRRPHHDGSPLYVSNLDPALGETVEVRVRVPRAAGVATVHVRSTPDGEPVFSEAVVDRTAPHEVWWRVGVRVSNPVTSYRFLLDGSGGYRWLTAAGIVDCDPTDATDFRLSAFPPPPAWAADAVCYQVFPDRFARSAAERSWPEWAQPAAWDDPVVRGGERAMTQLYGGDLPGLIDRLGHIQHLGIDTVYLTPIFPAPSNHRYNASSFDRVDPLLGGDDALVALSQSLHDRGMRLIGDLTVNHSGDTHEWFRRACADASSTEAAFYRFRAHPHDYETWLDVATLPKFDHRSDALRERLYAGADSVAARWLRPPFCIDGWRVDAANVAARSGEVDGNAEMARALRATMAAARPDALLIAEHCHDASRDLDGSGWHGTMNDAGFTRQAWTWLGRARSGLGFLGAPVPLPRLTGGQVARSVDAFRSAVGWRVTLHNFNHLGSHDTARFRTVAGARERALVGATWLLTWPGIPLIFAGDELGLEGLDGEGARQPMPWGRPERWDHVTLRTYRELIRLRRAHPALRRGGFRWVHVGDDVLVYLRELPEERILVQLARDQHPAVELPTADLGASAGEHLLGGEDLLTAAGGMLVLPRSGPAAHVWRLVSGARPA